MIATFSRADLPDDDSYTPPTDPLDIALALAKGHISFRRHKALKAAQTTSSNPT